MTTLVDMIDSHAHLDSERYDGDRDAMLERAYAAGVRGILSIGIGDGPDTMQRALEICAGVCGAGWSAHDFCYGGDLSARGSWAMRQRWRSWMGCWLGMGFWLRRDWIGLFLR